MLFKHREKRFLATLVLAFFLLSLVTPLHDLSASGEKSISISPSRLAPGYSQNPEITVTGQEGLTFDDATTIVEVVYKDTGNPVSGGGVSGDPRFPEDETIRFNVVNGLEAGVYQVRVTTQDNGVSKHYYADLLIAEPEISITPEEVPYGYPSAVTIEVAGEGTSFSSSTTVAVRKVGESDNIPNATANRQYESPTRLSFDLVSRPDGENDLAAGKYEVRVTTAGVTRTAELTIYDFSMEIVNPENKKVPLEYVGNTLQVEGTDTNFIQGTTRGELRRQNPDGSYSIVEGGIQSVSVQDAENASVNIKTGLGLGQYRLRLTTGNEVVRDSFEVYQPEVEAASLQNGRLKPAGYSVREVIVNATGSQFESSNTTIRLLKDGTEQARLAANVENEEKVRFNIPTGLAAGTYTARISTSVGDNMSERVEASITIYAPQISISPNEGNFRSTVSVTATGTDTNFAAGDTEVRLYRMDEVTLIEGKTGAVDVKAADTVTFNVYLEPPGLSEGQEYRIRVRTEVEGNQETAFATFKVLDATRVAPVTANPDAGKYVGTQQVQLATATSGAEIYYTTDGTEPIKGSGTTAQYTQPLDITKTTQIRARAYKDPDMLRSAVSDFKYYITPVLTADTTNNTTTQDIELTFTDAAAWRAAISEIYCDGQQLDSSAYTIESGKITLDKEVFATPGTYAIVVKAADYLDAEVTQQIRPTLTVDKIGEGTVTPTVGEHVYSDGDTVTLKAEPDAGWVFDKWVINDTAVDDAETSITMEDDVTATAYFKELFTLTVEKEGDGSTDPAAGTFDHPDGTDVTVTATPDSGWYFDKWEITRGTVSENVYENPTTITITEDTTAKAYFLEIPADTPPDKVTGFVYDNVTTNSLELRWDTAAYAVGYHVYREDDGEYKHLTSIAETVYEVTGLDPGTQYSFGVASYNDYAVSEFVYLDVSTLHEYTLTIETVGEGSVTVDPTAPDNKYAEGTEVTLTAEPDAGWVFEKWVYNGTTVNDAETIVTMEGDITATAYFLEILAAPEAEPPPGTYETPQQVELTTVTDGATIRYTTDGTEPTRDHGQTYTDKINVVRNTNIRAFAYKDGMADSEVVSFDYYIKVSAPVADPPAGDYDSPQQVELTSDTEGATIRYTTDGSTPTLEHGYTYTEPIAVDEDMTVTAYAYKEDMQDSDLVTFEYTIADEPPIVTGHIAGTVDVDGNPIIDIRDVGQLAFYAVGLYDRMTETARNRMFDNKLYGHIAGTVDVDGNPIIDIRDVGQLAFYAVGLYDRMTEIARHNMGVGNTP